MRQNNVRPQSRPAMLLSLALLATCAAAGQANANAMDNPPVAGSEPVAEAGPMTREALSDAWWTGPLLANSAGTLPRGHFLAEPYLFDVKSAHNNSFGSLTYLLYGVTDRLTVGLSPTAGFNEISGGKNSSAIGVGDITLQAQYGLTRFDPERGIPATAISLQETLPTGRYDKLGDRPSDGQGEGAYTTTLALYAQDFFWLPNGRILRARLDISGGVSNPATIRDVSVYGTSEGFRGKAKPGDSVLIDNAYEYSLTQRWVLAIDFIYRHDDTAHVSGFDTLDGAQTPFQSSSAAHTSLAFAPAVEYNWTSNLGVIFGVRVIPAESHVTSSVTPVVAVNMVY